MPLLVTSTPHHHSSTMHFLSSLLRLTILAGLLVVVSVDASPIPASIPQGHDSASTIKKPCPNLCPLIYKPVCAKNKYGEKRTFSNSCALGVYNCEHPKDSFTAISETACEEKPGCL
ncbi:MAG: hypothetical protein J3R72DRAFT_429240 [Linnemannia gamsii]|nr:MAG: hypothetical protein J3R72DRAFT_429240 [Linnemannia gamsii]